MEKTKKRKDWCIEVVRMSQTAPMSRSSNLWSSHPVISWIINRRKTDRQFWWLFNHLSSNETAFLLILNPQRNTSESAVLHGETLSLICSNCMNQLSLLSTIIPIKFIQMRQKHLEQSLHKDRKVVLSLCLVVPWVEKSQSRQRHVKYNMALKWALCYRSFDSSHVGKLDSGSPRAADRRAEFLTRDPTNCATADHWLFR